MLAERIKNGEKIQIKSNKAGKDVGFFFLCTNRTIP